MEFDKIRSAEPLSVDTVSALVNEVVPCTRKPGVSDDPCGFPTIPGDCRRVDGVGEIVAPRSAGNKGVELLYAVGESIFSAVAPRMVELGWSVFPQEQEGRAPGSVFGQRIAFSKEHDLENSLPTNEALRQWVLHCPRLNVACVFGPASGDTWALDIDITDEAFSCEVSDMADEMLGYTPFRRVGMAPKLALIYRQTPGDAARIRSSSHHFSEVVADGKGGTTTVMSQHGIEVLSDGKPLTFHGRHHKTGGYFKWLNASRSPLTVRPDEAPLVTKEQLDRFMAALQARHPFSKAPSFSNGGPVTYGDASGIRVPVIAKNFKGGKKDDKTGLITDGREAYMARLTYEIARGNGWQILEAEERGDGALLSIIDRIASAALTEFCANAQQDNDRWGGENLKREIGRKVGAVVRKIARGDGIRPAAIMAADRQENIPEVLAARRAENRNRSYVALGADAGTYYFIDLHHQPRAFQAAALEKTATLNELAPPAHWQEHYGTEKGGIATSMAAYDLMSQAREAGVYDAEQLMGRGAWWINGQAVFHDGAKVFADGVEHRPGQVAGKIFPRAKSLGVSGAKPLSAEEASLLFRLCGRWQWRDQEGMVEMAAGAVAQATICGALPWRTHYFISAEFGAGKTEFMNVIARILGTLSLNAMGDSTAKGILQALKYDALPITMDEPESQSENDRRNTQELVNMFRKASSETGAKTYKGTTDHKGTSFKNSCMGILAAIQSPIIQAADQSRWVPLDMVVRGGEAERKACWQETEKLLAAIPADFGVRLLARMLGLLPVIRQNIDAFGAAIAKSGGTGRLGRNLGVPLACAHALRSDSVVTEAEALAYLGRTRWLSEAIEDLKTAPEWSRVFGHLCQQRVEIPFGNGAREWISVRECVGALTGLEQIYVHHIRDIKFGLSAYGIRVDGAGAEATVSIANNSVVVPDLLKGTPWCVGWVKTIERTDGARKAKIRFTTTWQDRSTVVPAAAFLGLDEADAKATKVPVVVPMRAVG